jgi:hypothetical protein
MTDDAIDLAKWWLARQRVDGECYTCGAKSNERHEPPDPCGIVAGLLTEIERRDTERRERLRDYGGNSD